MCDEWFRNKLVNPDTGRKIKQDGPTFKAWQAKCGDEPVGRGRGRGAGPLNCDEWFRNKLVNPDTGRKIKQDGPTFKAWTTKCKEDRPKGRSKAAMTTKALVPPTPPQTPDPPLWTTEKSTWTDQRLANATVVQKTLRDLGIKPWEYCMSSQSKLTDSLTNITVLGKGSFGQVYLGYIRGTPVAIKEAKLERVVQNRLAPQSTPDRDLFPDENLILDITNDFVRRKMTPNFIVQYHVALCNMCSVETLHKVNQGMCSTTFMEPGDGTLGSLLDVPDVAVQVSMLYQLLLAVSILHQELQLIHNDIKLQNIIVKATPELKGTYFVYVTPKGTFYVPNRGYVLLLADFGVSYSLGPLSSTKEYGMRNAKVVTRRGVPELQPITSENHFVSHKGRGKTLKEGPRPFTWKVNGEPVKGTVNILYKDPTGANIRVSEPIDITKPLKYPPQEFICDIQDAIRTFVGGKRMTQGGYHPGLEKLSPNLNKLLKEYCIPRVGTVFKGPISTKDVWLYLALEMLSKVYAPPADPSSVTVSGVFTSGV